MATIRATPEGQASVVDADVSLTSLQVRALMLCYKQPVSFYQVVKKIQMEPELRLIPLDTISREVANLVIRDLVTLDKEN
jgi:hypothetical protein